MPLTPELPLNTPVLFYDGYCGFCNGIVRFILRIDRSQEVLFAPVQSELGKRVIRAHHLETIDTAFVAVRTTDTEHVWIKSDLVRPLMSRFGFFWRVMSRLLFLLPRIIRNFGYDLIAKNRYKIFGRYDACPIPPKEVRSRFIETI